jgi:cobalt-zinc-cadmium efflux system outer membrane protein
MLALHRIFPASQHLLVKIEEDIYMRIITVSKILCVTLFLLIGMANAVEGPLSVDEAIRIALKNNRDLKLASMEKMRAETRLRWAGRLENPQLDLSINDDFVGEAEGEGTYSIGFSQAFPLTSRLKDAKKLNEFQLTLADVEILESRRSVAMDVEQAIIQLAVSRHEQMQFDALITLNQEIIDFLQLQVSRGESSALEVVQATINGNTIKQKVRAAEAEQRGLKLMLNQAMGLEPDASVQIDFSLSLPDETPNQRIPVDQLLGQRPDYLLSLAKVSDADLVIALEHANRWEDISLSLFAERESATDEPSGLEENTLFGVGVSIPLPFWKRNREAIELAAIDRIAAEQRIDALQFQIRSEYEEAFQLGVDSYTLAKSIAGDLLSLAEKNFSDLRLAYEQGQASLLRVQLAQEKLIELKSIELDAIAAYHLAASKTRYVSGAYPRPNPTARKQK